LYKKLSGGPGIPHAHWFGTEASFNVIAIDHLGQSLEDLFFFAVSSDSVTKWLHSWNAKWQVGLIH